jgi:hypothetical protein
MTIGVNTLLIYNYLNGKHKSVSSQGILKQKARSVSPVHSQQQQNSTQNTTDILSLPFHIHSRPVHKIHDVLHWPETNNLHIPMEIKGGDRYCEIFGSHSGAAEDSSLLHVYW